MRGTGDIHTGRVSCVQNSYKEWDKDGTQRELVHKSDVATSLTYSCEHRK